MRDVRWGLIVLTFFFTIIGCGKLENIPTGDGDTAPAATTTTATPTQRIIPMVKFSGSSE